MKKGQDILLVCLYVDDLIYMGTCAQLNDDFKASMMQEFEMKDIGLMHYFLGMEVTQGNNEIICQFKYAHDMLKYGMDECKPIPTPIVHGKLLCKDDGKPKVEVTTYRSLVESMMFITNTRLNIAHVVSLMSRYMSDPTKKHMKATKRIMRYVKGTSDFGIHYYKNDEIKLCGYSHSDWGSNLDDRKSTSGQCFSLGWGLIS